MKVPYEVILDPLTGVEQLDWNTPAAHSCDSPTLAELQEAAQKEFPEVPAEELLIYAWGRDAEIISLKKK